MGADNFLQSDKVQCLISRHCDTPNPFALHYPTVVDTFLVSLCQTQTAQTLRAQRAMYIIRKLKYNTLTALVTKVDPSRGQTHERPSSYPINT